MISQSFMNGNRATVNMYVAKCMQKYFCICPLEKKIKLLLFYSGLPVTLSKSGLYPFLVSFLFGAMMQVILIL